MARLIINARESEKRIVVENEGDLRRVYIEQPDGKSLVGNIYLGIVERVIPSLNAAFVNIGKGKKGYLHLSQIPSYIMKQDKHKDDSIHHFISQGEKVIIQVQKDESDKKYYRITGNIEFSTRSLVYMPYGRYVAVSKKLPEEIRKKLKAWGNEHQLGSDGIIFRTMAEKLSASDLVAQLQQLKKSWEDLLRLSQNNKAPSPLFIHNPFLDEIHFMLEKESVNEVICDDFTIVQQLKKAIKDTSISYYKGKENIITHYSLQKDWETLMKKIVWLKNGSNIVIEESEAFTIIDVNTAKFTGNGEKESAIRTTNKLAAVEAAKQIQLRNIGGNIFIDFINIKEEKDRQELIRILKKALEHDTERTIIYGFTALGILEMSRKRTKPSLSQQLMISCPTCQGTGFVHSAATVAFRLERELWEYKDGDYSEVIVEATDDVIAFFTGEHKEHMKQLEDVLFLKITFDSVNFAHPHYHIKRFVS